MREIKFRALEWRGGWRYGHYVHDVLYPDSFKTHRVDGQNIDENTLGQFTGLKDKNGKEVYEGDIIKYHPKDANYPLNWWVEYNDALSAFVFMWRRDPKDSDPKSRHVAEFRVGEIEVIGNVHESPELLTQQP